MVRKDINKKDWEISIIVPAEKDKWKQKQNIALKEMAKSLKVKGFRPGKVTVEVAKKTLPPIEVQREAVKLIANDLVKIAAEEIDENLIILDSAIYDIEKISDSELELKFTYPIYPEFTLKNYTDLNIPFEQKPVTEKEIMAEIDKIVEKNALLIDKEENNGKAEKGDVVNINYVGKVDGEEFKGGSATSYELLLGSKSFIDNFEDQLINHKNGDQVSVKVNFPKEYHSKELAGKEAIFDVKINNVFSKEKPKLDDSIVHLVEESKAKTLDELKNYFKNLLSEERLEKAKASFKKNVFEKIKKSNEIPIPKLVLMKETTNAIKEFEDNVSKHGYSVNEYLKMLNMDNKEFVTKLNEESQVRLSEALIFTEISKQEKIEASEKEYEKEYEKFAKLYKTSVDSVKSMISKEQLQVVIVNGKVLDFLIKKNSAKEQAKTSPKKTKVVQKEKKVKSSTSK